MIIKKIDNHTRDLSPPEGVSGDDCGHLFIRDVKTYLGNEMYSAWEPTPKEIDLIKNGATIYLGIIGTQHPMVRLLVGNKLLEEDE
ncbi:MAG: hypothetical protein COY40_02555 [Alphaproteobacteria bacterium CG_4_10_14_0_8_um_filter_53_9]|nr:MAG: hypothetical protein COY40_02555 [Alphaproteobacteria bacterium CG_4_10_14_0_8_um_filter_53_9]